MADYNALREQHADFIDLARRARDHDRNHSLGVHDLTDTAYVILDEVYSGAGNDDTDAPVLFSSPLITERLNSGGAPNTLPPPVVDRMENERVSRSFSAFRHTGLITLVKPRTSRNDVPRPALYRITNKLVEFTANYTALDEAILAEIGYTVDRKQLVGHVALAARVTPVPTTIGELSAIVGWHPNSVHRRGLDACIAAVNAKRYVRTAHTRLFYPRSRPNNGRKP
jgi:hypothetical protein